MGKYIYRPSPTETVPESFVSFFSKKITKQQQQSVGQQEKKKKKLQSLPTHPPSSQLAPTTTTAPNTNSSQYQQLPIPTAPNTNSSQHQHFPHQHFPHQHFPAPTPPQANTTATPHHHNPSPPSIPVITDPHHHPSSQLTTAISYNNLSSLLSLPSIVTIYNDNLLLPSIIAYIGTIYHCHLALPSNIAIYHYHLSFPSVIATSHGHLLPIYRYHLSLPYISTMYLHSCHVVLLLTSHCRTTYPRPRAIFHPLPKSHHSCSRSLPHPSSTIIILHSSHIDTTANISQDRTSPAISHLVPSSRPFLHRPGPVIHPRPACYKVCSPHLATLFHRRHYSSLLLYCIAANITSQVRTTCHKLSTYLSDIVQAHSYIQQQRQQHT
jgi:hypothetical protein